MQMANHVRWCHALGSNIFREQPDQWNELRAEYQEGLAELLLCYYAIHLERRNKLYHVTDICTHSLKHEHVDKLGRISNIKLKRLVKLDRLPGVKFS